MKSYCVSIGILFALCGAAFASGARADITPPGVATPSATYAQLDTAFTYQGQLKNGGAPVNGACDIAFRLYDTSTGGAQVGAALTTTVAIAGGLFTIPLDFGSGIFTGDARWLDLAVRCPSGGGPFTALTPRQTLKAAPYAFALPGLFTQPNPSSPNVIGGYSGNVISPTSVGSVIGGGGSAANANRVLNSYGTVSGGISNTAAFVAVVGGGEGNVAGGYDSAIGGGYRNVASFDWASIGGGGLNKAGRFASVVGGGVNNVSSFDYSTVGGGANNIASAASSVVSGGYSNTASATDSFVGGGYLNVASAQRAVIGGGTANGASGDYSVIAGGQNNQITGAGDQSVIGGGVSNSVTANLATIAGGQHNVAGFTGATIGGGGQNTASGLSSLISGGYSNTASATDATVGGGYWNAATAQRATVSGGTANTANGQYASVGGGQINHASGDNAAIGGGSGNTASGIGSVVAGGISNTASGDYAFAAGYRAKASQDGAFVWADDSPFDFGTSLSNTFRVRSTNGVRFVVAIDNTGATTVSCLLNDSTAGWSCSSDRNVKENFSAVDSQDILRRLSQMPISRWNIIGTDPNVKHVGPTAQDFAAAFNLGNDDKLIGSVDAQGVALAAIQGLYQQNRTLQARVDALENQASPTASFKLFDFMGLIAFAGFAIMWLRQRRAKRGQG